MTKKIPIVSPTIPLWVGVTIAAALLLGVIVAALWYFIYYGRSLGR